MQNGSGTPKVKRSGAGMGQRSRVSCSGVQCDDNPVSAGSPSSGLCQRKALLPGGKAGHRAMCSLNKDPTSSFSVNAEMRKFFLLLAERDRLGGR